VHIREAEIDRHIALPYSEFLDIVLFVFQGWGDRSWLSPARHQNYRELVMTV